MGLAKQNLTVSPESVSHAVTLGLMALCVVLAAITFIF
jgi:hypothetical protein